MEHIYTIKVKRKFDPRGQFPSERRYSASTVFGFAWVHLALAFTTFLLACLALYNPSSSSENLNVINNSTRQQIYPPLVAGKQIVFTDSDVLFENITQIDDSESRSTEEAEMELNKTSKSPLLHDLLSEKINGYESTLIIAPSLLALGAFAAGFAAIFASKKWYVDHSITWFFLSSILSTILSLTALGMITLWMAAISESNFSFCDYFSDGNLFESHVEVDVSNSQEETFENNTLLYVIKIPLKELRKNNIPLLGEGMKQSQTRKVLSVNILIAAIVEIIWSLLSLKIAWSGMRASYPDDDTLNNRGSGTRVQVVTELKGNNTKRLPKNTKILPPKPDLIEHYPKNNKIKKFFQNQQENGSFFLHANQNDNGLLMIGGKNNKPSDFSTQESSSEYRERMLNFLNKCASNEGIDSPESYTEPVSISVSENPNPPVTNEEDYRSNNAIVTKNPNRLSIQSWGDIHDHTIYDQNTLDLERIMMSFPKFEIKPETEADINDHRVEDIETITKIPGSE